MSDVCFQPGTIPLLLQNSMLVRRLWIFFPCIFCLESGRATRSSSFYGIWWQCFAFFVLLALGAIIVKWNFINFPVVVPELWRRVIVLQMTVFFHYAHWRHARAVDIGSCTIVEDAVFDKCVVLSLEAIASKDFHPVDCVWQAEQCNPVWLYLSLTALLECFEDITVNSIRKSISVPCTKRSQVDVISVAVKHFQTLATSMVPMTDQAVVDSFEGSMTGTGNHKRSSVQAYNAELGLMDPELDVATYKKLKPYIQLLHYSCRKCLLSVSREEMQEALRLSMLQWWKELILMPLGMILQIINCYVANMDLVSPYTICDIMD
ncbi:hypothetical protein ARMGADRAFT_1033919 [Armillaria gallica]|uniref:Uncharacterized protein n=1 Tax=Armillaria gallica TaxID=47427 RepID=A0A2H3CZX3_ARMGA|nr:hypothetical protein ARMGADRAFT_1033919 [Armillaria gallica]